MSYGKTNNRWYDQDPTVSIAISILRNADRDNQLLVAAFLEEKIKSHNISIEELPIKTMELFPRRWYDFDEKLHNDLEVMRLSSPEIQKELALEIINYLCSLDICRDKV